MHVSYELLRISIGCLHRVNRFMSHLPRTPGMAMRAHKVPHTRKRAAMVWRRPMRSSWEEGWVGGWGGVKGVRLVAVGIGKDVCLGKGE